MNPKADAVDWMEADHREVTGLFEAYDALCERHASDMEKAAVTDRIRELLSIRAQVEEEVLGPALRKTQVDLAALDMRMKQRRSELMSQYQAMRAGTEREDESADPVGRPAKQPKG